MTEWESGHYANPKRTQGPGLAPNQGMVSSQWSFKISSKAKQESQCQGIYQICL